MNFIFLTFKQVWTQLVQSKVDVMPKYFLNICDELFVCVEAERPSQQFFSHVGMEPSLPG